MAHVHGCRVDDVAVQLQPEVALARLHIASISSTKELARAADLQKFRVRDHGCLLVACWLLAGCLLVACTKILGCGHSFCKNVCGLWHKKFAVIQAVDNFRFFGATAPHSTAQHLVSAVLRDVRRRRNHMSEND